MLDVIFTLGGSTTGVCTTATPWEFTHSRHQPTPGLHGVAAPSTTLSRGSLMLLSLLFQPFHLYGGACSFGGLAESHPIPPPSLHGGEGSSFPGLVPSSDMVDSESVMGRGIKHSDSGVVVGYQVDEFTHTWSAEQFVACSLIYSGFTGKVSSLTHFPLEPGCEDYSFLDQAVAGFEQGLDTILTDSLDTSWTLPWMSLMPLHLQSLLGFFTQYSF